MTTDVSKFKASILSSVGTIEGSNLSEHRVLVVRDDRGNIKVSAQVWWRDAEKDSWKPGKGFFLSGRIAIQLADVINKMLDGLPCRPVVELTNTQRYVVEKDDKLLSIKKMWRKDDSTEDWRLGKSLELPLVKAKHLVSMLGTAGLKTIHSK